MTKKINEYIFFILLLLSGQGLLSGCNEYENRFGELTYREKNKDGILCLDIFKKNVFISEVHTGASIYQRYKIKIISDKYILLNSSDVGLYMISEIKPNVWKYLEAAEYDWETKKIFVVFTGNIEKAGIGNIYDQITLICLDNSKTFHLNLTGMFFRYEKFLDIIDKNTFSIYDGEKKIKFRINNDKFVEF